MYPIFDDGKSFSPRIRAQLRHDVKGANHGHSSHGRVHTATNTATNTATQAAFEEHGNFNYKTARDAAVKAQQNTFPLSLCSAKCLKSQLDKYDKESATRGRV